ncbi:MAG: DUF4358 domain-containing protein [Ruminococcaceae bacterium]|jgi:hypothetical protein|nr:DUF4358 domain-containing protein [Oscillospiraceae bacterium]
MKKRLLFITFGVVMLLSVALCACAGKTEKSKVSMYDLKNAMANATESFGEMSYASSEDDDAQGIFANISDMDYSKVESFFIYYATDGTGNADEIAVIKVKNDDDVSVARKALEDHLAKRTALYSTYDKTQLKKLDSAKVTVSGGYAALVVGDDAEKITNAFNEFLK